MLDGIVWIFQNLAMSFYNFGYAVSHPALWLDWSDKQAIMRFVYYGGSVEFFFVVFSGFLLLTAVGLWKRQADLKSLSVAAWMFTCGIALFSGALYVLVIGGPRFAGVPWGAVAPLGGTALLIGWLATLVAACQKS